MIPEYPHILPDPAEIPIPLSTLDWEVIVDSLCDSAEEFNAADDVENAHRQTVLSVIDEIQSSLNFQWVEVVKDENGNATDYKDFV